MQTILIDEDHWYEGLIPSGVSNFKCQLCGIANLNRLVFFRMDTGSIGPTVPVGPTGIMIWCWNCAMSNKNLKNLPDDHNNWMSLELCPCHNIAYNQKGYCSSCGDLFQKFDPIYRLKNTDIFLCQECGETCPNANKVTHG